MTDFEKSIKREMTREKFLEIRDHKYGYGINILKYTYGQVSSWLTWNRDEKGDIAKVDPPDPIFIRRKAYYDGPIDNWDKDKPPAFSSKLTTDIVFLGLNMADEGKPLDWDGPADESTPPKGPLFQNARGVKRIVDTFSNTAAEGAYFTDIIKPDRRILEKVGKKADAKEFMRIVKTLPGVRNEHIRLFLEELVFIGAVKPLLIVFGNDADWILRQGMSEKNLTERFHAVVKIGHYSPTNAVKGGDEGYRRETREDLVRFITIP